MTSHYWFVLTFARSVLRTLCSFEIVDDEKTLERGGAIIAANHASYLDPPLVACSYKKAITFLARSTLFKGFWAWLLPRLNAIPLDREGADLKSMRTIIRKLKEGSRVLVFPEGTRTHDGSLGEAKAGIGLLVAKSGVPVQPVRIVGSFEAWPRSSKPKRHKIRVYVGDPIVFSEEDLAVKSMEGYQAISDRILAEIAALGPKGD